MFFPWCSQTPAWLEQMIAHTTWRDLFYKLAEAHPDCLMLNFTVKVSLCHRWCSLCTLSFWSSASKRLDDWEPWRKFWLVFVMLSGAATWCLSSSNLAWTLSITQLDVVAILICQLFSWLKLKVNMTNLLEVFKKKNQPHCWLMCVQLWYKE